MASDDASDINVLEKVLFHLAVISDDDKMAEAIDRILPKILPSLAKSAAVRTKAFEVCSFISGAIKSRTKMALPVVALLDLHCAIGDSSTALNPVQDSFTCMFLEMAFARLPATSDLHWTQAPRLLINVAARPAAQQALLLHTFCGSLSHMSLEGLRADRQKHFAPILDPLTRPIFLQFCLDVLLYAPLGANSASSAPHGLSTDSMARVVRDGKATFAGDLAMFKCSILKFLMSNIFDDNDLLLPCLVAACDQHHSVVALGQDSIRNLRRLDLEDADLVNRLIVAWQGTETKVPSPSSLRPVSEAVRLRVLSYLSRSIRAANNFPATIKIIFESLFSENAAASPKLQASGLVFAAWVCTQASAEQLTLPMAKILFPSLLKLLVGALKEASTASTTGSMSVQVHQQKLMLRGSMFSVLGQLVARQPSLAHGNVCVQLSKLYFSTLGSLGENEQTSSQIEQNESLRQSISDGLHSLRSAFMSMSAELAASQSTSEPSPLASSLEELKRYLLTLLDHSDRRVVLRALMFINRLFQFSDCACRFSCARLTVNAPNDVRDEASKGLQAESYGTALQTLNTDAEVDALALAKKFPPFPDFAVYAFRRIQELRGAGRMDPAELQQVLSFIEQCAKQSAMVAELDFSAYLNTQAASLSHYLELLYSAFELYEIGHASSSSLQASAASALFRLVDVLQYEHGDEVQSHGIDWLRSRLLECGAEVQRPLAQLLGRAAASVSATRWILLVSDLIALVDRSTDRVREIDAKHGTLLALGPLLSQRIGSTDDQTLRTKAAQILCEHINHDQALFASAACTSLACFSQTPLSLPLGSLDLVKSLPVVPPPAGSTNDSDADQLKAALAQFTQAGSDAFTRLSRWTRADMIRTLIAVAARHKDATVVSAAIDAVGRIGCGDREDARLLVLAQHGLLGLAASAQNKDAVLKEEELHLAIGEALALTCTAVVFAVKQDRASGLKLDSHQLTAIHKTDLTQSSANLRNLFQHLLCVALPKASSAGRKYMCLWMLAIVQFAGWHPILGADSVSPCNDEGINMTVAIQNGFLSMLSGDQAPLTQEAAAKGLSLLFDSVSAATRNALIEAIVTHMFGKNAARAAGVTLARTAAEPSSTPSVSEQAQVAMDLGVGAQLDTGQFTASAATGSTPGSAVSTYRELVSVAMELGDAALAYQFFDLANAHSLWNTDRARGLQRASVRSMLSRLSPKLGAIIPKLYRYNFDSNDKVRVTMAALWKNVVTDPQEAIERHFDAILSESLKSIGAREMRVREASTLAVADLIANREFPQVGRHLQSLWTITFRALDDGSAQDNVRVAAVALSRALLNLTARLCDTQYTKTADAAAAVEATLPILLGKGLTDHAKEVRAVSIQALIRIVKIAGPLMRPHLAALLTSLLEGESSLEPALFNYLQFHTEKLGLSVEELERRRMAAAQRDSPLHECVQLCLAQVRAEDVESVSAALSSMIQSGLGLPTLTGCARAVIILCTQRLPDELRPHVKRLVHALQTGLREGAASTSPTVRRQYCAALGQLAKVAKKSQVQKMIEWVCSLYSNEKSDSTARSVAAILCLELVRAAPEAVAVYHSDLIPLVFLASYDSDKEVSTAMTDCLDESVPSRSAGASLWANEIIQLSFKFLASDDWLQKRAAISALDSLICLVGKSPNFVNFVPSLLSTVLPMLAGRIWDGKQALVKLCGTLAKECSAHITPAQAVSIVKALIAESARPRTDYRAAVLQTMSVVAVSQPIACASCDALPTLCPVIDAFIIEVSAAAAKPAVTDSDEAALTATKNTIAYLTSSYECAIACFVSGTTAQRAQSANTVSSILTHGVRQATLTVRLAAYTAFEQLIQNVELGGTTPLDSGFLKDIMEAISNGVADSKFSAIRFSSMNCIKALLGRKEQVRQMQCAEEVMGQVKLLSERRLQDSDPRVAEAASKCHAESTAFTS